MKLTHSMLALALIGAPIGVGCSHDDPHAHDGVRADRTTGDEHDGDHDRDHDRSHSDGVRVTTRDSDHDGTDDTVDAHRTGPTAMDQSEAPADLEITRQIRSAVVGDSSLSFGARNCVIITRDGVVTLRGDVTRAERDTIDRHAHQVAGVTRVDNDLHATDTSSAE